MLYDCLRTLPPFLLLNSKCGPCYLKPWGPLLKTKVLGRKYDLVVSKGAEDFM